jgi:pimeloyl-ACP methyl ester carboxylesterase
MGTILYPNDPFILPEPLEGIGPLKTRVIGSEGPVVVLIHGLGRVAAVWSDVARLTQDSLRLVLLDNPGIGRSSGLKVPSTVEGHAELIAETLHQLGFDQDLHVAGLSLGGMIAPALSSRLGSRAASVTLLSSSARESGFWRLSPKAMIRMGGRMLRTFGMDHRVNMPELVSAQLLNEQPDLWRQLDLIQHQEGFSAAAGTRQLLAAARFRIGPHLDKLPIRRFVAVGSHDRLVPPQNSGRLAKLLGCELETLLGCHHDLSLDAPSEVARLLCRAAQVPCPV